MEIVGAFVSITLFVAYIFGVWRGFKAHILLGLLALFVFPLGLVVGAVYIIFSRDMAQGAIDWVQRGEGA